MTPRYEYTDLGGALGPDGTRARVQGLHHPADEDADRRAQYEVRVDGTVQLDAADPVQRAELEKLIAALQHAVAHGECVGWTGEPAETVTILDPKPVEWMSPSTGKIKVTATSRKTRR